MHPQIFSSYFLLCYVHQQELFHFLSFYQKNQRDIPNLFDILSHPVRVHQNLHIDKQLDKLTPEQDFMLGIMLGYDKILQCKRYFVMRDKLAFQNRHKES